MKHSFTLVLLLTLALTACKRDSKFIAEYNQKLTLYVQTPNGPVSASAVTREKSTTHEKPLFATGTVGEYEHYGEAVAIQLGDKWLFALLKPKQFRGVYNVIPKPAEHETDHIEDTSRRLYLRSKYYYERVQSSIGQAFDVPLEDYPMLVSFADINDPASVFEVDPTDLAASFGEGYALDKMTVQVTDEPVTEGAIEGVLGWLGQYRKEHFQLNGRKCVACPVDGTFAETIGTACFKIGKRK